MTKTPADDVAAAAERAKETFEKVHSILCSLSLWKSFFAAVSILVKIEDVVVWGRAD